MSNIKVGDRVQVELLVKRVYPDGSFTLSRSSIDSPAYVGCTEDCPEFIKHIPAPFVPRPGDIVRRKDGVASMHRFTVVAVSGDYMWVRWLVSPDNTANVVVPIDKYVLAE